MIKNGFAKQQFVNSFRRIPWNQEVSQIKNWPFLDSLFEQKRVSFLHYYLAIRLLDKKTNENEETALFLCHLSMATEAGHLCIHIKENEVFPSPRVIWQNEEGSLLNLEDVTKLTLMIINGSKIIPQKILMKISDLTVTPNKPICQYENCFYLQKYYFFENLFLKHLKRHLENPPTIAFNPQKIKQALEEYDRNQVLLKEQSDAILQGCLNSLSIICGGPGTGKTYTTAFLIKVFWDNLSNKEKDSCQIFLAAPTGKAVANLQSSIKKASASFKEFPILKAKTLHALLGVKQNSSYNPRIHLAADLIIVDESSMIDIKMMAYLFQALKAGSRLILLGDPHQLPSIEPGGVFVDLIESQFKHPHFSCNSLSICKRTENLDLGNFSQFIRLGQAQEFFNLLKLNTSAVKKLNFSDNVRVFKQEIISSVPPYFLKEFSDDNLKHFFKLFASFRILSSHRKGPLGVESINEIIWHHISSALPSFGVIAIPIMIVTNDYRQDLFNGETGILFRQLPLNTLSIDDYALFPSREDDDDYRRIPALLLPRYEMAYCLSIHKSQGSEFDHILLVLPNGAELFGREIFYTAMTRARKSVEIYGSDIVIAKTIMHKGERFSGVKERLVLHNY